MPPSPQASAPDKSPFAQAAPTLRALGYHCIPLLPGKQIPGQRRNGKWVFAHEWQAYRDRPPTEFELNAWSSWPDANVGIVLGTRVGDYQIGAVDLDALDPDDLDQLRSAIPQSPFVKVGSKGETRLFRMPPDMRSRGYRTTDNRGLADLLTGQQTKQTVMPPSLHPLGPTYRYLAGPVAAQDLPVFDKEDLARLEDTLAHLGWGGQADEGERRARRQDDRPDDEQSIWQEVNDAAMRDLEKWVPELGLMRCRPVRRGGYEAVADWRASGTGQPLADRKLNLKIHPQGIRDMGADKPYTPLDLVTAAKNWDLDSAYLWLKDRVLGPQEPVFKPVLVHPAPTVQEARPEPVPAPADPAGSTALAQAEGHSDAPSRRQVHAVEMPEHLLDVPGLVGDLKQWILDTARRPQPALALASALCVVGTAAGRVYAGPTESGTHLFIIGLAPTSGGKDHGLKQARRLLDECGLKKAGAAGQWMSMSALAKRLQREPLTLATIDELGAYLGRINNRKASRHEQAITGLLREVWGSSFDTVSTPEWANEPSRNIECPALSILGVSTHGDLFAGFQEGDIANGFLNRFLLVSTHQRVEEREPVKDKFTVPVLLANSLRRIAEMGGPLQRATMHNGRSDGPVVRVPWDSEAAHAAYVAFGREVQAREEDQAFLGRTVEMSLRLATIRAIGCERQTPRVTVADMEWGRDLALWSGEQMIQQAGDYMAESDTEHEMNRLLRKVREVGSIEHWRLLKFYKKDKRGFQVLMETLEARGDVISKTQGAGRVYVAT